MNRMRTGNSGQEREADRWAVVSEATSGSVRCTMLGSTARRYCFTGTPKRRQDSTTERMAATLGPDFALPACSQFLRLCARAHNRNYVEPAIMWSW